MASNEQKLVLLVKHFHYEVVMMRATHVLLAGAPDQLTYNAFHEAFCIHARNLIEFFKNKHDCDPRWYTQPSFKLKKRFIADSALTKIIAQVAHLLIARANADDKKITIDETIEYRNAIEDELQRFLDAMTPEYRDALPSFGVNPIVVRGAGVPGSTNHVSDSETAMRKLRTGIAHVSIEPTNPARK